MGDSVFIVAKGVLVPQEAIAGTYFSIEKTTTSELPRDNLEMDPTVVTTSRLTLSLNVQVKDAYLPQSMQVGQDDEEVEEEEVEEAPPAPRRRGRKSRAEKEAEEAAAREAEQETKTDLVQEFPITIETIELDSERVTLSTSAPFAAKMAKSEKAARILERNFGKLHTHMVMLQQLSSRLTADPAIDDTLSDLVPSNISRETMAHTQSAIEAQQNRLRAEVEKERAAYDRVLDWFQEKVIGESMEVETIPFDLDFLRNNGFTNADSKKLIAKVRENLATV